MKYLLPNFTFPCLEYFSVVLDNDHLTLERCENYQKRTYRNKYQICGPQGMITLSIPLLKGKHEKQNYIDTKIANTEPWQRVHWRTLETNYGNSPFFSHYAPMLEPFFIKRFLWLYEFNLQTLELVLEWLGSDPNILFTNKFEHQPEGIDLRGRFPYHKYAQNRSSYSYEQVFSDRLPFIANLSILDLIFCLGPESKSFLQSAIQNLDKE